MKKTGLLFVMAAAVAFGLNSCKKDDDEGVSKPKPKFTWIGGSGYVSTNATVTADSVIMIGINATGEENLESVGLRVSHNGGQEAIYPITDSGDSVITSLKTKTVNISVPYETPGVPGTVKLRWIVKMSNGEQTDGSITLTVAKAPIAVQSINNVEMGAQSNATYGSFYSLTTGQVMLLNDANSNPEDVDWIYYFGATNKATLAAPDDGQVTQFFNGAVGNWSTRNKTRFRKTTMTSAQFDNVTNSAQVDAELSAGGLATMSNQLAAGDVVLFKTGDDQNYGLIRINSISPASESGKITYDIKNVPN